MKDFISEKYAEDFLNENGYLLIGKYSGYKNYVDLQDEEGYKYRLKFFDLRRKIKINYPKKFSPLKFSTYNPFSIKNVELWVGRNISRYVFVEGVWGENNNEKSLYFKCLQCHQTWNTDWASVITNRGCPYCAGKRVGNNSLMDSNPEVSEEWDYEKNPQKISPINVSKNSNLSAYWLCEFGHSWLAKINARNSSDKTRRTDCPTCASIKKSKGEREIEKILRGIGLEYISQKKFKDCLNLLPLPFDFYIPSLNLCIEYHGEQHYESVRFGGVSEKIAKDNLKKTKINDSIKKKYCKKNNISLLTIPYWKYSDMEKIINKIINS